MNNKVLLVTGAGSGLGQLAAKRALADGWCVTALDVNPEGLAELQTQLDNGINKTPSSNLLCISVDITDAAAVQAAADQAISTYGQIDRVVNAAAIMPLGLLTKQPGALCKKIMDINYGGLINIKEAVLPAMLARGSGEFVSFASMSGHWPIIYMGAYAASKHAVASYTEVLHHENKASGVRIVCVCPPIVATPLLKQAEGSAWPKLFDKFPPLTPECVLDKIEVELKKDSLWVFPGNLTKASWYMRRWMPNLLWRYVHSVEGF